MCSALRSSVVVLAVFVSTGCEVAGSGEPGVSEPLGRASDALTVGQAVTSGCSDSAVKGLSDQIIAQAACDNPDAFVKLPPLANVSIGNGVTPYLEKPAHDAFIAAANANPGMTLGINSMLRTVAEQYVLYRWYQNGQCGIQLAAVPGNSNHETGLAFDTSQYNAWMSTLSAHHFKWYGSADVVHFDYIGPGAVDERGADVKAFQELWNKNHPGDMIAVDGAYGPQTEARLVQSPAGGFPMPVQCAVAPPTEPDVWMTEDVVALTDAFSDGSSHGVKDTFEGETFKVETRLTNKGTSPATTVAIGVSLDGTYLAVEDYLIESDWMNGGSFKENDANSVATNPKHGVDPGASFDLQLNQLSPGETKRVTFTVRAAKYSVDMHNSPGLRVFVKDIPNVYSEPSFGGVVTNPGKETFNGGRLEVASVVDVYSHVAWEWNSDRLEGFSASTGATVKATGNALQLQGGTGLSYALSPTIAADPATAALTIHAMRMGGTGDARVALLTAAGADVATAPSVPIDLPADGAFHDVTVKLADSGATQSIVAFAIVPFDGSAGTVDVDSAHLDTGMSLPTGSTTTGAGGSGAGGGAGASSKRGSCKCSAVGSTASQVDAPWLLGLLGLVGAVVRRRGLPRLG